jgi:hypothetical protein
MKRIGKIAVCLAGGLVFNTGLRADNGAVINNPYAPIVVRNVFGLNPPPPPVDPNTQPVEPPPKITPNGIMSIFGQLQVLFKVAVPASNGKPAEDKPYILGEGEGQDEIEVVKIDDKAGIVTFNNHGIMQDLPLADSASASSASSGTAQSSGTGFTPSGFNGINRFSRFNNAGANIAGSNPDSSGGYNNPNDGANSGANSQTTSAHSTSVNQQPALTPEEQIIMIEAQRQQFQSVGDPTYKILPTTPLTQSPDSGDGNSGDGSAPPAP